MFRTVATTAAVCAVIGIGSQAFSTYTLRVPEPEFGAADYSSATITTYLWGALTETQVADCLTSQLDEVQIRHTLPNTALSVLTMGLWTRTEVLYRCGKPDSQPGNSQ